MGFTHLPNGLSTGALHCDTLTVSAGTTMTGFEGSVTVDIADVSAASTDYISLPFDAEILGANVIQYGTTSQGSTVIGFTNGSTNITGMTITISPGGAIGAVTTAGAITAGENWSANTALRVKCGGESTTSAAGKVTVYYKRVTL